LDSSNGYTPLRSTPEPEWVLRSVSASWNGQVEESGLNLNQEGVRRFSLPSHPLEAAEPRTAAPKPQIVLIEDNKADVGLISEALEEHGVHCDVTVISNGEIAIKFIDEIEAGERPRPDLVIIDLNLPKKPGKEVLKYMRACTACKDVPVVVLTSSDNQKDKDAVAPFAPLHYLTKPSNLDEFINLGALFKRIVQPGI
jgi:chemotaxis family two-component system response regulator Rcp1